MLGRKIFLIFSFVSLSASLWMVPVLSAEPENEIANVNGVSITIGQFEKRMSRLTREGQGDFSSYEVKKELLDLLIAREVLNQEGRRLGIAKTKMFQERIREFVEEQVIRAVVNQIAKEKVTPEGMKKYYKENRDDFREVHANHILVKTEEEAKEIKKKLEGGADFATLAKEVSTDAASASRGGDLGFFTKERMIKPFSDAAFSMKVNEISEPVRSPFGYHLIKVVETKGAKDFDQLSQAEHQSLHQAMINSEIDQLKEKAKVEINEKRLQAAASEHARPEGGDK